MKGFRQWLIDTYNGLYVIVLKPHMPTIVTVVAVVLAMLFGLLFWGYSAAPVRYYDGLPYQLDLANRDEWVKLVAGAKYANLYTDEGILALLNRVEDPVGTIERLIPVTTETLRAALIQLQAIVYDINGQPLIQGTPAPQPSSFFTDLLTIILAVVVMIILAVVISLLWRILIKPNFVTPVIEALRPKTEEDARRQLEVEAIKERRALETEMRKVAATAPVSPYGPPLMQRLAIYTKGRQFDESFAIEDENNVFYGEAGATITRKIGDDVAAIEVWLFDKEDFVNQLVKVFASEKAFSSPELRTELEEKVNNPATDIIVARPGAVLTLETDRILVTAKLVDAKPTATAPNSTFDGLTVQMEGWSKGTAVVAAAATQPMVSSPQPVAAYQPQPIVAAPPPQPLSYQSPTQSQPPYTPPMPSSVDYTPPPVSTAPRPYTPPPVIPQPTPMDDDPFGGTADFDPIED